MKPVLVVLSALAACLALTGGCRGNKKPAQNTGQALPLQTFARQWATDLTLSRDTLRTLHVRPDSIYAYTAGGRAVSLSRDGGSVQFSRPIKGGQTALHAPVPMSTSSMGRAPRLRPPTSGAASTTTAWPLPLSATNVIPSLSLMRAFTMRAAFPSPGCRAMPSSRSSRPRAARGRRRAR